MPKVLKRKNNKMPRKLLPSGGYYYYGKLTNTQSRRAYQSMGGVVSTHQVDPDPLEEKKLIKPKIKKE